MILKPRPFRKPTKGHWATDGLIGCWLMNEGSGDVLFDLSGNGNIGKLQNSPTWGGMKFGQGLTCNGTNQFIWVKTGTFSLTSFTYSVWAYIDAFPGSGAIGHIIGAADERAAIRAYDTGTIRAGVYTGSWNYLDYTGATGQWYHLVFTVQDSVAAYLYVNGKLEVSDTSISTPAYQRNDFCLGANYIGGNAFAGRLDHAGCWNRALSNSEIAHLYRQPFCMFKRDDLWSPATQGGAAATVVPQLQLLRQMWAA